MSIIMRQNKSGIASFSYHFNGTIGGNDFRYDVAKKDDGVIFTYNSMLYYESGSVSVSVDKSILERLNEVYMRYHIAEWNGFDKYNSHILDGCGFSLEIYFNDGASLSASGMNAFPKNYNVFCKAMDEIFDPVSAPIIREMKRKQEENDEYL